MSENTNAGGGETVVIPREPTKEMLAAAYTAYAEAEWDAGRAKRGPERETLPLAYKALIDAAPAPPPTELKLAEKEARSLAIALWQQHYREDAPHWKVLPDLRGALSQIDNMTTGLVRKPDAALSAQSTGSGAVAAEPVAEYSSRRWEDGFRSIVTIVRGARSPFTIPEIVEAVRELALAAAPLQPAGGGETIRATQITLGEGLVDITRIAHEGRVGVLFRPRAEHIPFGQDGELQEGAYWPGPNDVVLWVSGEGPQVAIDALAALTPADRGETQAVCDPLVAYLERQWAWSRETFGPALRTNGIVQHITKELREIEADPHDLAEWVDVIILAMDGFWRHGGQPADLLPAMQAKQDRNFARTWPDWRTMGEDQAIEHDRSGEASPDQNRGEPDQGGANTEAGR